MGEVVTERPMVTIPDKSDYAGLEKFINAEKSESDRYGMIGLQRHIRLYLYHANLCDKNWKRVEKSLETVNGLRKRPRNTETTIREYLSLVYRSENGTQKLRAHAKLFGLDYQDYSDIDELIEAIVDVQDEEDEDQISLDEEDADEEDAEE